MKSEFGPNLVLPILVHGGEPFRGFLSHVFLWVSFRGITPLMWLRIESPLVFRRPFCLSHAAKAVYSRWR